MPLSATQMAGIRYRMEQQMLDSIVIESKSGNSAYGPVYDADATELWRLEPTTKSVTNDKGEEVTAALFGLGPHDSVAKIGDKVTWDGGVYRVIVVKPIRQFAMVSHVEAYFEGISDAEV